MNEDAYTRAVNFLEDKIDKATVELGDIQLNKSSLMSQLNVIKAEEDRAIETLHMWQYIFTLFKRGR